MKKMKKIILSISLSLLIIISFTTCKNDLNVLAPGDESVSIYGVINPNQTIQNIRINKVYLTDGDALAAGKDGSQINYGPGELTVSLQRFMTNSTTQTLTTVGNGTKKEIVLTETVVTTSDGNFNTGQRIWQTTDKLYSTGEYKLIVKINATGKEFSSQNVVIDSVRSYGQNPFVYNISSHPAHGQYVNTGCCPTPQAGYIDYSVLTFLQHVKFTSIPNARLYNVTLRFHYIDSLISGGTNEDYVDYLFPTQKSASLSGGETMDFSFSANDFYLNVASEMSKKNLPAVRNRRAFYLEYIITAGSESLNTFLQVNQPSNTIAQDKPSYSNINGGVGLFSSSSRSIITHDLWVDFIDKIACHPSTNPYMFCNSLGVKTGVCP